MGLRTALLSEPEQRAHETGAAEENSPVDLRGERPAGGVAPARVPEGATRAHTGPRGAGTPSLTCGSAHGQYAFPRDSTRPGGLVAMTTAHTGEVLAPDCSAGVTQQQLQARPCLTCRCRLPGPGWEPQQWDLCAWPAARGCQLAAQRQVEPQTPSPHPHRLFPRAAFSTATEKTQRR